MQQVPRVMHIASSALEPNASANTKYTPENIHPTLNALPKWIFKDVIVDW
jgi:hypothetical protein